MKRNFIVSLLILLSTISCTSNPNFESPSTNTNPGGNPNDETTVEYKMLSLGDSYTIGQSVCEDCKFPVQLKDSLNQNLINYEDDGAKLTGPLSTELEVHLLGIWENESKQWKYIVYNDLFNEYFLGLYTAQKIIDEISATSLGKLVFSRTRFISDDASDLALIYDSLNKNYPNAFTYIINIPGIACWIGATPEILLVYLFRGFHVG